jgi:queuine tRNA-ribosyltransferase
VWQSKHQPGLSWTVVAGDFPATISDASFPPDLIFYDMFSSKTSAEAWTLDTFRRLFTACDGRAVEMFTYTCSTSVRVALLAAGFYVAKGCSMGAKEETTIAMTPAAYRASSRHRPSILASAWLARWNRSGAKFPADVAMEERSAIETLIRQHDQFHTELVGTGSVSCKRA